MSDSDDGWKGLKFGEGVYKDHERIAREAEEAEWVESREIEEFWAREQLRHELFGSEWETEYETRKSKARWSGWDDYD